MAIFDSWPESKYSTDSYLNNAQFAFGQSFMGLGVPLNSCQFYLSKTNLPTGNAVAKLYAHSGTFGTSSVPTGSALATSNNFDVSTLTESYQLITLTFSTPYTPIYGTYYVIVLEYTSGDATNLVKIGSSSGGSARVGNMCYYTTSWIAISANDLIFYLNTTGTPPVAVRAVGISIAGTSTTTTPTIPAATQTGDLMVAFVPCRATATPETETGWDSAALTLSSINMRIYYRYKQAGDSNPTFDITNAGAETVSSFIISFYNVDPTTPFDVAITDAGDFSAPGSPYDVTLTGFNTSTDGAFAVYGWVSLDDNTWVYQSGGGAGLIAYNAVDATDISVCVAGESIPTAGGTGDQVARQTAKAWDAGAKFYFALKPAAEAAGGPTGLKTINDLAKASVKVINGVTMANTKTWGTLAELADRIIWRKAA